MKIREPYWALKKITVIFQVFAWLAVVLGIVFCVIILVGGGTPEAPRTTSLLAVGLGAFYFVFFYTVSEVLKLMMAIEQNTRKPV